jgi:hypothetical protein
MSFPGWELPKAWTSDHCNTIPREGTLTVTYATANPDHPDIALRKGVRKRFLCHQPGGVR